MKALRFPLTLTACITGGFGLGWLLASKYLDDMLRRWQ